MTSAQAPDGFYDTTVDSVLSPRQNVVSLVVAARGNSIWVGVLTKYSSLSASCLYGTTAPGHLGILILIHQVLIQLPCQMKSTKHRGEVRRTMATTEQWSVQKSFLTHHFACTQQFWLLLVEFKWAIRWKSLYMSFLPWIWGIISLGLTTSLWAAYTTVNPFMSMLLR